MYLKGYTEVGRLLTKGEENFIIQFVFRSDLDNIEVGADCGEGPPVPIPNTEVKLTCAYNTWLATAREDR